MNDTPMNDALLSPWTGPYGGVPPFGRFAVRELGPALTRAIALKLDDIERIAGDPAPPTFENTIAALERTGSALRGALAVYGVYTSTMNDDEVQAIEREMAPKLAALDDVIVQNARLFARVARVYATREDAAPPLTAEQRRLVWVYYTSFVRSGAQLDDAAKKVLFETNQRLATLYTEFAQNVLAEENEAIFLEAEAELDGLPPSVRDGAAAAAASMGRPGAWAILNTRSSVDPFLSYATRRDLRERVFRMFTMRGDRANAHDNNAIIGEVLQLRARRAKLLGYATHAHWQLEDSMAKTPERAMALLEEVWKPAVLRVREEVRDMQALADAAAPPNEAGAPIAPWDYRFYADKVRKAKFDLDEAAVRPYLSLERLREGMFWVAGELYGLRFSPIEDGSVAVYHPDVRVFRVEDGAGAPVGLWFFDPYARRGKSSGAWMSHYRTQSRMDRDVLPILSNNANFVRGAQDNRAPQPVLMSWDDARTLFHEFGHALHGLLSRVTYPSLSGTYVARDYVEFPSQIFERWLATPELLDRFARHVTTGAPMPRELVRKIAASETFNQGFATVEYLASALVDLKLHLASSEPAAPDAPIDAGAFEARLLASIEMPAEVAMRHRTAHFGHVFSGDGYSAAYYSYLWADTLSADAFDAFAEAGGPYDKVVAARLRDCVLSVGNTVEPAEGYRAFRGRDPAIFALMRQRGFAPVTGEV
jgi:peptidyl-dipeptidase Dcp